MGVGADLGDFLGGSLNGTWPAVGFERWVALEAVPEKWNQASSSTTRLSDASQIGVGLSLRFNGDREFGRGHLLLRRGGL